MLISLSAIAAPDTPPAPQVAASADASNKALASLKGSLNIQGATQEKAWLDFTKGNDQKLDLNQFKDLSQAKTTPELFNGMEKIQELQAKRFIEQKSIIMRLYETLNEQQRQTFDKFVFSTMLRMASGSGVNVKK